MNRVGHTCSKRCVHHYSAYGIYYLSVPRETGWLEKFLRRIRKNEEGTEVRIWIFFLEKERTLPWYERTLFATSGARLHRTCVDVTQQRPLQEKEATRGRTITCLSGGKLGLQVRLHMGNQRHMPQTLDGRSVKRRKLDNFFGIWIRFVVSFQDYQATYLF